MTFRQTLLMLLVAALANTMACSGTKVRNAEIQDTTMEKTVRRAAVAGSFYPDSTEEVLKELKDCFKPFLKCEQRSDIQAVIVPHAGWVFSGEVAASAFARIDPAKHYERIFLIGPSHQVWLDAVSVNTAATHYATLLAKCLWIRLSARRWSQRIPNSSDTTLGPTPVSIAWKCNCLSCNIIWRRCRPSCPSSSPPTISTNSLI